MKKKKDTLKESDFLLIPATMIKHLGMKAMDLATCIFGVIHGFTKDGEQTYKAQVETFQQWTNASPRAIKYAIEDLLANGYIGRRPCVYNERKAFEYWSNLDEVLDRARAGEDVRFVRMSKSAKSAPVGKVQKVHDGDAKSALLKVQKVHDDDAKSALSPNYKVVSISFQYYNSILFQQLGAVPSPVSEQEKEEFFAIFFCKNAADPAAEVSRFIEHNAAREWSAGSVKFDTPIQRRHLAENWTDFKTGKERLTANSGTAADKERQTAANKAFLAMLGDLYGFAMSNPSADLPVPRALLNTKSRVIIRYRDGGPAYDIDWVNALDCVQKWVMEHIKEITPIVQKHFHRFQGFYFSKDAA